MISPFDVLQIQRDPKGRITPGGVWSYKGRQLTKGEIDNLKAEADLIAKTSLWKILVNEGKYHAQKHAIVDADDKDDTKALTMLRGAQAYHQVVVMFEQFIQTIITK